MSSVAETHAATPNSGYPSKLRGGKHPRPLDYFTLGKGLMSGWSLVGGNGATGGLELREYPPGAGASSGSEALRSVGGKRRGGVLSGGMGGAVRAARDGSLSDWTTQLPY